MVLKSSEWGPTCQDKPPNNRMVLDQYNDNDSSITLGQPLSNNSPASRDIAFHMHPYTNPAILAETDPHIMAEGHGVFVVDENGNRFYEGMSGLWCLLLAFLSLS